MTIIVSLLTLSHYFESSPIFLVSHALFPELRYFLQPHMSGSIAVQDSHVYGGLTLDSRDACSGELNSWLNTRVRLVLRICP